jgi:uncharacterized protein (DUF2147 family)
MASYSNCTPNTIKATLGSQSARSSASPGVKSSTGSSLQEALKSAAVATWEWFTADRSQPRVQSYRSQSGEWVWDAFDPCSGKSYTCASEAEMRVWLESRYYRS